MESVIENIFKVTIVIKEIECTERIVHENWNLLRCCSKYEDQWMFFSIYKSGKMVLADK